MCADNPTMTSRATWSNVLKITRDPEVEEFSTRASRQCLKNNARLQLPDRYAFRQFRLHVPALSRREIVGSPTRSAQSLVTRLHHRFHHTSTLHRQLIREIGPGIPDIGEPFRAGRIHFRPVPDEVGRRLHAEVHYLHCPRTDTVAHAGAFPAGATIPALCLSYSFCDREYLLDALATCLPSTSGSDRRSSVLVLTRAVSTVPLPKNLMSSLIGWSLRDLRHRFGATLCVTALNPFLGFDGAAFRAAGFVPFALSPMTYQYDENGMYVTRREAGSVRSSQMLPTPPIVWLFRLLTSPTFTPGRLVSISSSAYLDSERK